MPAPFAVAWLKAAVSLGHYIFMTLCCLREEEKKRHFCLAGLPLTSDAAYSSLHLVAEPYFYVPLRYSTAASLLNGSRALRCKRMLYRGVPRPALMLSCKC